MAFGRPEACKAVAWIVVGAGAGTCLAADSLPRLVESHERAAALAMIAAGGDVDERSADGTTALHWAAHHNDLELVEQLLEHGAEADVSNDYGATPLSAAAVEADYRIVKALLEAGADVDSPNPEGQTALMVVARTGQVETARLLLQHGADVNAREEWGGQTALMWAAAQRQPAMIRVLAEHGADVDAFGRAREWERRVTSEPRIKLLQTGGFTPLLFAAREGCAACIVELADAGADLDLGDPYGVTPLVLALLNRHFDTAAALIEAGADVDQWDWWGRSPLYVAIELNWLPSSRRGDLPSLDELTGLDIARMLLERGANVNMRLKQQPPMRSEPGDRGYVDGSPDVLTLNIGATALHAAVKAGDNAAVRLLLEHGADVEIPNVFGITPMLAAAGVGHWYGIFIDYALIGRYRTGADAVATMKILRAAGADVGHRTSQLNIGYRRPMVEGLTAAHGAALQDWPEVIEYLHEIGADIDTPLTSSDASTPRDLARAEEKTAALAMLDALLAE